MRCQWLEYLKLLPEWLREPVDRLGRASLTELRLRINQPPQLVLFDRSLWLEREVSDTDLNFCMNAASQYSPWSSESVSSGYITTHGGHRIGICGETVVSKSGSMTMRFVSSLCIRVARDFSGIAEKINCFHASVLLIGPPGSGKTTMLRDMIRQYSNTGQGSIGVLDERGELFPIVHGKPCFPTGRKTDVLTGCRKSQGIITLIRCMSPSVVALDEITDADDCDALTHAMWCGVKIWATAHASSREDLLKRSVYKPLVDKGMFDRLIVLQRDKSWRLERMQDVS